MQKNIIQQTPPPRDFHFREYSPDMGAASDGTSSYPDQRTKEPGLDDTRVEMGRY